MPCAITTKERTMSTTITVEEAQAKLRELIHHLAPGEELVITENQQPVAKLVGEPSKPARPGPGLGKGSILYMAPDFDEALDDMKEYME
jgi:antitoxin (DNA-binding transcriptional repressor) of toxin-antitoxin stability system